ncbi:GIY-YIG nuclease family protein [Solibacillus sp. FSL H8-0538]|uniref:GIY-YIG nuclease family protein n=1 Tax=Solibacillus sp. FSL H8-0538 TaxID=2921400 RepID=UPI0030FCA3C5
METKSSHYFYVLECSDSTYYAGYTNNLEKRVATHNAGKGAKYTRARSPVTCVYYETFETKQEAMRAEYAFKQLQRSEKIQYMRRQSV